MGYAEERVRPVYVDSLFMDGQGIGRRMLRRAAPRRIHRLLTLGGGSVLCRESIPPYPSMRDLPIEFLGSPLQRQLVLRRDRKQSARRHT